MPAVDGFDYRAVGEAVESRREELNLTPSGLIRSINWLSAAPLARLRQGGTNTCQTLMLAIRATVAAGDFEIAMDLGAGMPWTFRSSNGKSSFQYQVKKSARSVLHASPADFMRLVFQDLDPGAACASGRVQVEGDIEQVIRLFGSLAARA